MKINMKQIEAKLSSIFKHEASKGVGLTDFELKLIHDRAIPLLSDEDYARVRDVKNEQQVDEIVRFNLLAERAEAGGLSLDNSSRLQGRELNQEQKLLPYWLHGAGWSIGSRTLEDVENAIGIFTAPENSHESV